jgi:hypothetical protein
MSYCMAALAREEEEARHFCWRHPSFVAFASLADLGRLACAGVYTSDDDDDDQAVWRPVYARR